MADMQLRSAMHYVKNLEQMKRFYGDLLKLEPANENCTDEWVTFDSGAVRFMLHAIPAEIAARIEITSPPEPREDEPVKLIFEVKDVERERERLESLGIQIVRRLWQRTGEACDVVDPEGNVFQLCSAGALL